VQPPIVRVSNALQFDELADGIHVALHNVSAETSISLHGEFEINQCSLMQPRK
jgi:hypothetical protein